jgi:hypothetical protein
MVNTHFSALKTHISELQKHTFWSNQKTDLRAPKTHISETQKRHFNPSKRVTFRALKGTNFWALKETLL